MNAFIIKSVLKMAKKVRFLVTLSKDQLKSSTGASVVELFRTIKNYCAGMSTDTIINSVQPVITHATLLDDITQIKYKLSSQIDREAYNFIELAREWRQEQGFFNESEYALKL